MPKFKIAFTQTQFLSALAWLFSVIYTVYNYLSEHPQIHVPPAAWTGILTVVAISRSLWPSLDPEKGDPSPSFPKPPIAQTALNDVSSEGSAPALHPSLPSTSISDAPSLNPNPPSSAPTVPVSPAPDLPTAPSEAPPGGNS